jgi:hypothetical protein
MLWHTIYSLGKNTAAILSSNCGKYTFSGNLYWLNQWRHCQDHRQTGQQQHNSSQGQSPDDETPGDCPRSFAFI